MWNMILRGCAGVAAALLAAITLGIAVNVVLRNAFGAPVHGLLDLVEYGLLLVTFLGAPWVLSRNAHVVVDLVTGAVPVRVARVMARAMAALGCAVSLGMVWYGGQAVAASFRRGSVIRTAFDTPEWWVLSVLPVAFVLIAIEFARQAVAPPGRRGERSGL